MLHNIHLLGSFFLVCIESLQYKKKYVKRIRSIYFSNLAYVPRIFLGGMALPFITELIIKIQFLQLDSNQRLSSNVILAVMTLYQLRYVGNKAG